MISTAKVVIAVIHVDSSELSMFSSTTSYLRDVMSRSQNEDSIDKPI